jgi:hypothetical protein
MGLGSKIKAGIAIAVEAVVVKIYIKKGRRRSSQQTFLA